MKANIRIAFLENSQLLRNQILICDPERATTIIGVYLRIFAANLFSVAIKAAEDPGEPERVTRMSILHTFCAEEAMVAKRSSSDFILTPLCVLRVLCVFALILLLSACSEKSPRLAPLADDAVILAFGDSITYGTGAGRNQNYPAILERLTGRTVINAGVPGEVTAQGVARLPDLLEQHQPGLLILCHGGNDMLRKKDGRQMLDNLRGMILEARSRDIEVILIGVPKPAIFLGTADGYAAVAKEFNIPLLDETLADILSDNRLKSDTIHPNDKGYRKLAESAYELLKESGAL